MTLEQFHTNPTQVAGVLGFGLAAVACCAAARGERGHPRSVWPGLAIAQFLFALEVLLGLRHRLHDLGDALLVREGWYVPRSSLQVGAIAVALALTAGGLAMAWRRSADASAVGALTGTTLAIALFGIEVISLHAVDALMYARIGPVMVVGWLWTATAATVALCALNALRR